MFAFRWGEPPATWENALQIILGKDEPGELIRSTHTRRIQLVCAGMNMGFRQIWGHSMLQRATAKGLISDFQFGARSGHMSLSAVLLKRASYDIIRLMRTIAVIFDNDATACYDRMIPSQCMTLSVRAGVRKEECTTKLRVLQKMKYRVKTAYGVSPNNFTCTDMCPILGLLQGSAAVGAIWALVSSLLFQVLASRFQAARFQSPRVYIFTERHGEAFVDDTTLWLTALAIFSSIQSLTSAMQDKAQVWERLLWTCGGALNLKKCYWYAISWKWDKHGKATMCSIDDTLDLKIRLSQGADHTTTTKIERVDVSIGRRTLGMRLAPLGTDNDEFEHRKSLGQKMRKRMMRAPLNRESTRIGFFSIAQQQIGHTLPVTCFSQDQCSKIQSTYLPTFLSKMGINKNSATEMRSGPLLYGGMAIPEIWTSQGSGGNKMLTSHLRKDDIVGQTITVELDALQIQAGTSWNVLSRHGGRIHSYVDKCWTSHIWEFNDLYGLSLHRDDAPWMLPQRENDLFIMEELAQISTATTKQLQHSQRCRLYLGVSTLADISSSGGKSLADWVTNYTLFHDPPRLPTLQYPAQQCPPRHVWNDFIKLIQRAFTEGTNNKLTHPLGAWYHGRIQQAWPQVYSVDTDTVYSFTTSPHPRVREYTRR